MAYSGINFNTDQRKGLLGGSIAGAAGVIVLNPVDLIKCRAQNNRN
jgi:hypothetical protein